MERLKRISEAFNNQYWSRIVSLQDQSPVFERHAMADDITEAHNELDELSHWESLGHMLHFDPRRFIQEHPEPAMEAFRHNEDELRHWAR